MFGRLGDKSQEWVESCKFPMVDVFRVCLVLAFSQEKQRPHPCVLETAPHSHLCGPMGAAVLHGLASPWGFIVRWMT